MGFFRRIFCKQKNSKTGGSVGNGGTVLFENSDMLFYINLPEEHCKINEFGEIVRYRKDVVYGPFTLCEIKNDYPILEDTLITTDVLDGEWYEARYFECFDELFDSQRGFVINEFGEIVRR